ncbi:MAG: acyl dehydratase [Chloroflexi bacterium]|nr:acyl dehydratase [Chloroflexota bacterium]
MTTATGQRYWEDVADGEELAGYELRLTWTKMVQQVSGSQDFYPVHHDPGFAREAGHSDIFYNTSFTQAALSRLLTDWVGPAGWVRRLGFQMRKMNMPDDRLQVKGVVTGKAEGDGPLGEVSIDLWIENDRVGITTPAEATVLLPRRG